MILFFIIKVIKERDNAISKINDQLLKIWKLKFSSNRELNIKKGIAEKKYYLNTSLEEFKINKVFISSFLKGIWAHPEAIYNIILNSQEEEVKKDLAPFIVNNCYCNYLSGNYLENNILYIITLMLKDEINKLDNIKQVETFLENSKCGYLLEELQKIPDIQIYLKNVIFKTVEKIERSCSFREMKFNVLEKQKELIKLKEAEEKKYGIKTEKSTTEFYNNLIINKIIDQDVNKSIEDIVKKLNEKNNLFAQKYVVDITIKDLEEKAEKAKKENKKNLFVYYNKLGNDIKISKNEKLYSNEKLMKKIYDADLSSHILTIYQNDCLKIISFIEKLLEDLTNNILLMPNSIKYICKIISILIKKKFPNITKIEENAFISRFFFGKLLAPIISFPSFNALISNFVISRNTLKNIQILNIILKKFFAGKLFINNNNEFDYTFFNWLFLDKMDNILSFYKKVMNVNLPNFIEKFLNDKLPKDYLYEYFNENKGQIYANISIYFSIDNLYKLVKGLENSDFLKLNNPIILKFKKSFEKLNTKEVVNTIKSIDLKILNSLKENLKIKEINEIENIYIFNSQSIEEKYQHLFVINNKNSSFFMDLKKDENLKALDDKQKNIIKVKNYLYSCLGNYRLLNRSDFSVGTTSSTIKMLNEIKTYMILPNFLLNNSSIPSVWYINSILHYLNKIPDEYKEKDYKKLFREFIQNLNDSINYLDFEKLILFRNKLKFLDKMKYYYENIKQLALNISINEKIRDIVEELYIPVDVIFKYEEDEKKFEIAKSNIKEKIFEDNIIIEDFKKNLMSFKNIEAFTKYFPDVAKYQLLQEINPINIIKELSINYKLNNYFEIIKEKILKNDIIEKNKYESLYKEKIKDYIMNKIYEKIYPPEPDELDIKIYRKSMHLSWVKPNLVLDEKKNYIIDILLPEIINEFQKINISKTPLKKLNCFKKIMDYTISLIKFNEGENIKPGQEEITPALHYIFIKAHPFRMFTDIDFIKLFWENKGEDEHCITNIESIYSFILNSNNQTFNLTQEEYNKRCTDATNNI